MLNPHRSVDNEIHSNININSNLKHKFNIFIVINSF